jgi:hypothetical protein
MKNQWQWQKVTFLFATTPPPSSFASFSAIKGLFPMHVTTTMQTMMKG